MARGGQHRGDREREECVAWPAHGGAVGIPEQRRGKKDNESGLRQVLRAVRLRDSEQAVKRPRRLR